MEKVEHQDKGRASSGITPACEASGGKTGDDGHIQMDDMVILWAINETINK